MPRLNHSGDCRGGRDRKGGWKSSSVEMVGAEPPMAGQCHAKCLMVTESSPAEDGGDETALGHSVNVLQVGGRAEVSACPLSGQ